MELVSVPTFYLSAPTSPNGCSPENVQFYSTQSSPVQFGCESGADKTGNDEFEFEFEFETGWAQEEHEYRLPARANSFSAISFADELFCNGQVLPLKLPPRLQTSVPTSPRSFSSRVRNPFAQRCTWNDGFDPFMIALEKVTEEPEGRMSVHRGSSSYSPLRARGQEKEPAITEIMDRKGSVYSRWVRSQTMVKSPTARTMMKRLWLGRRVRDADISNSEPLKRSETTSSIIPRFQQAKIVAT